MSGNEPGRKAGLECSLYFLFQCPSLICFFVEGKGEKGSVERKGDTSGQCESWEAVKTYKKKKEKKENAQHSLPSPSLPLGRTGQEILFWKWSETWSGAIGKMGDRSRRNKVGRPRYPHTKECRLFADNSPEIMSGIL